MRADKHKCPRCCTKKGVEIAYGLPGRLETDKRKGVRLQGGCVIYLGISPDFKCLRCQHAWRRPEKAQEQLASIR